MNDDEKTREIDAILAHLRQTYTEAGVWRWLAGRNQQLSGERPVDLLAHGLIDRVVGALPALDQVAS